MLTVFWKLRIGIGSEQMEAASPLAMRAGSQLRAVNRLDSDLRNSWVAAPEENEENSK